MGFIQNIISQIPLYLLSLPVIFLALSVHETAHGYAAYKLGDPTARNLGRLTLNPVKHIDIFGLICMIIAHVGWAKPVPVNSRYFKKPRRDMAIVGAAGPLSNLASALIFLIMLRVSLIFLGSSFEDELNMVWIGLLSGSGYVGTVGFTAAALAVYIMYLGVMLNISLAIFNLLPFPPFDGSRIFYAFLPEKIYFGIMKYEQYIMIVLLVLFAFGFLSGPLGWLLDLILDGLFTLVGIKGETYNYFAVFIAYVGDVLTSFMN